MTTKTTSQRPTKNILSVNAEQNPKSGHAIKDGYKNQIITQICNICTYRVIQTIQMKIIILCVWAEKDL